jgi:1-acyl-sn-glycerol-3-phosphate acyltransferase
LFSRLFYLAARYVLGGPLMTLAYRPRYQGLEHVPTEGPVILASNHLSFIDSLFIPLGLHRPVIYLGKAEYFDKARTAWFFRAANVIPIRRENGTQAEAALEAGLEVLAEGGMLGIYPEGTRSPDGRLYRGRTGVARLALAAGVPVVPVCVFGTREVMPPGQRSPNLHGRVRVVFGRPLTFERYEGRDRDRFILRAVTDEIMYEIMSLSGQEYVDEYASRVRAQLAQTGSEARATSPQATAPHADPVADSAERGDAP